MTLVTGQNGAGKTSLIEAVGYASTQRSFRGSPREALVRRGATRALVRVEVADGPRRRLVELELEPGRRDRARLNRQPVGRSEQLLEALQVTVFTPDDLVLVKGPPEERRQYLDDLLETSRPRLRALRRSVDRVLRQRNTLLRQAAGRLSAEVLTTLDVWDDQLASSGEALVVERERIVVELGPHVAAAFATLTRFAEPLELSYQRSFEGPLSEALTKSREEDLRRGTTTVGPQRDELWLSTGMLDARSRLSQGQQRAATLALRLAGHEVVGERRGERPVLLLDDAFSELDATAASALLEALPAGQAIVTTTGPLPRAVAAGLELVLEDGTLR